MSVAVSLRPFATEDMDALVTIWRRAVEETHAFLTPDDIDFFEGVVRENLPLVPGVIVADRDGVPLGFIGFGADADGVVEVGMLFVDPEAHGGGIGSALLEAATAAHAHARVDVNEHNPGARAFYAARGFAVVDRSETDDTGRPFPILHLAR